MKHTYGVSRREFGFIKAFLQLILLAVVVGLSAYFTRSLIAGKPEAQERPVFQSVFTVDAVDVVIADNQPVFSVFGSVIASRNVELRALSAGEITQVSASLQAGLEVRAGDVLVEIDKFEYEGALLEAKANLAEAEARLIEKQVRIEGAEAQEKNTREQLDIARDDLARAENLLAQGTVNRKEVENRSIAVNERELALTQMLNTIDLERAGTAQLQAQIERLEWRVEQAERGLENTRLRAPFGGIVQSSSAELGRNANANDVLVSLYDAASMDVKFTLSDAQFGRLASSQQGLKGRAVEVVWTIGGKDNVYQAKLSRIGAQIATERGGVEVFATIENRDDAIALRPGAFVEIRVPDQVFSASIKLPEATLYDANSVYVLVDGRLKRRAVEVQAYEGDFAIVTGDLASNERVLNTRLAQISDGTKVRTADEPLPKRGGRPERPENAEATAATDGAEPARGDRAALVAQVREANGLSEAQWQALDRSQRQDMIRTHRQQQNSQ